MGERTVYYCDGCGPEKEHDPKTLIVKDVVVGSSNDSQLNMDTFRTGVLRLCSECDDIFDTIIDNILTVPSDVQLVYNKDQAEAVLSFMLARGYIRL